MPAAMQRSMCGANSPDILLPPEDIPEIVQVSFQGNTSSKENPNLLAPGLPHDSNFAPGIS